MSTARPSAYLCTHGDAVPRIDDVAEGQVCADGSRYLPSAYVQRRQTVSADGKGYADGRSYADGPRRRISSGPDGLVYADGPVGIGPSMPTGAVGIGLSRRPIRAMPTALAVGIGHLPSA